ncbi:16S rRNA (uracil(1498)-N(3))-methyltransferase [Treponema phagedenis]|uniref:Ribosomal RNA small subunit methyltransferase E n=1 Tax=Treponema phagedenis TaxID=162 RepID=A0A0B7GXN5_TREPH|nr:16S rRNA (uracil(1498)-N(3))-methyltransferase [Treponema phagedenis]NVP24000.1 16S rRNA (uracil(1498)-N(3))-methyltransferase [Treponema phagedenis]QEJ93863.1 16S rRNA (uracil(1498)-N(3))-methyltransferase [Treponema phagedenis]QEJ99431.1 16S rRNA (uracil(1498)-N(3))-methyltransferase [Treponema phagedenis]QEJ99788.1 16S rRNA (uracil(1498)-N(3))-methyltransferase [Treponema phagedenis]QEK05002.1 16S rRNA (uracil(1498)-N(3))-methyltransferase [Treponema phagedenis]
MKQLLVNAEVDVDGTVKLSGKDYHYLATVLRKRIGDIVILDLPSCGTVAAEIIDIRAQKKELDLQIKTGLEGLTQPPPFEIVLLQWLIRGQKMDSVIRQATELGVSRIIPIAGEFSLIKEENEKQTERRRRIIKEARQQSGSVIQTEISSVQTLDCALKNLNTAYQKSSIVKLLFTEKKSADSMLHTCLSSRPKTVIIAIGAEGGMSVQEVTGLKNAGFIPVHLHTNILRAETAAITACAAVHTILSEGETWQLPE